MTRFVLERIGVEPAERRLFGWAALSLLLLGASAYALLNTSETLFLKRVGVEYLPLALLASSGLLILTTALVGRTLATTADRCVWLPRLLLALGVMIVPFRWLVDVSDSPFVFGALLLLARQVLAVGLMTFWMVLADLVTSRQAKRLFGPLAAGVTVGGITGSFGSDALARLVGMDGLLLACGLSLAGAALASTRLRAARPRRIEHGLTGARQDATPLGPPQRTAVAAVWRQSRLFRLLAVLLLCGGLLSPILYYEFSYIADQATSGANGEARLLTLYSQFRGWLNVTLLFAQLWLSGRLYRRFGLPLSLALWPASYVLGFLAVGLAPVLPVAVLALGAGRITEDGISGSALRVLFSLFPEEIRSRAAGLLEGPITRVGAALGNGLMLVIIPLGLTWLLAWAALPIAGLWLTAALVLWRAYPGLLLQASSDRNLAGADKAELLDSATVRALLPGLSDPDPLVCRAAIDLVTDAEAAVAVEVLAEGAREAGAPTRPMVVDALQHQIEGGEGSDPGALDPHGRATEAIAGLLVEPWKLAAEERADLYRIYARLTGRGRAESDAASLAVVRLGLGDHEPAVRLTAMAELHRRGVPPPGAADLDRTLRDALTDGDVLVRRAARRELRAMLLSIEPDDAWRARFELLASGLSQRADRAETAESLVEVARRHPPGALPDAGRMVEWLDDPDPRARAAALRFVGHAALTEEAPRLTAALGSRDGAEAAAARDGLVALGPDVAHALLLEYEFGAPSRRDGVLAVLGELDIDTQAFQASYDRQLREVRRVVMLRGTLASRHRSALLERRLEERVIEGIGALLAYVGVLQDDPRIGELERRLRRARDARRRDILVEALEALLPPETRRDLVPLLEHGDWSHRAAAAAAALGRALPSAAEAATALVRDEEALTARLAERELSDRAEHVENSPPLVHSLPMLDPMDIAVRLQNVPAFSRLSTRQLVALAGVLVEVSCMAGETLFNAGDEGDGLYIVLEGSVAVLHGDTELAQRGPATFFGELSTLDGVPRAVTAVVREDAKLLRLSREDLVALMEDAPALAIGLTELLALRVRELQDRIG